MIPNLPHWYISVLPAVQNLVYECRNIHLITVTNIEVPPSENVSSSSKWPSNFSKSHNPSPLKYLELNKSSTGLYCCISQHLKLSHKPMCVTYITRGQMTWKIVQYIYYSWVYFTQVKISIIIQNTSIFLKIQIFCRAIKIE